jgi:hypothetical protein
MKSVAIIHQPPKERSATARPESDPGCYRLSDEIMLFLARIPLEFHIKGHRIANFEKGGQGQIAGIREVGTNIKSEFDDQTNMNNLATLSFPIVEFLSPGRQLPEFCNAGFSGRRPSALAA